MDNELRKYLRVIRKQWWLILAVMIFATTVTGFISNYLIKPIYVADTKLIVNQSNDKEEVGYNTDSLQSNMMLINTYKEIIQAPVIIGKALQQMPELKLTEAELVDKLKVTSINSTLVINLNVWDESQESAVKIVNTVAEVFKREIPLIMNVNNVVTLNEARVLTNPDPANLQPPIYMIAATVLSLILAVGFIVLKEFMDDTIRTEEQVEQLLKQPVLGAIFKIKGKDIKSRSRTPKSKLNGEPHYANVRT